MEAANGQTLASQFRRLPRGRMSEALSPREKAVFDLFCQGMNVSDIADQLCISCKTVNTYRTRANDKMGFKSASEFRRFLVSRNTTPLVHDLIINELAQKLADECRRVSYTAIIVIDKRGDNA